MGSENSSIRDSIQTIVSSQQKTKNIFYFGEVVATDSTRNTFSIRNIKGDSADIIDGININFGEVSNVGTNSFVTMPNVGSQVIVLKNVDDNKYYLFKFEDLSNYSIATSPTSNGASDDYIAFTTNNFSVNAGEDINGKIDLWGYNVGIISEENFRVFAGKRVTIMSEDTGSGAIDLTTGKFTMSTQNLGGLVKVIDLTTQLNAIENKVNSIITALAGLGITIPPLVPTVRTDIENTGIVQYKNI